MPSWLPPSGTFAAYTDVSAPPAPMLNSRSARKANTPLHSWRARQLPSMAVIDYQPAQIRRRQVPRPRPSAPEHRLDREDREAGRYTDRSLTANLSSDRGKATVPELRRAAENRQ